MKVKDALTAASRLCVFRSPAPQPLLFTSIGRMTKVGEDIVVPTKAAMNNRASGLSGIEGTKPLAMVPGSGSSMNMEMMKAMPIRVTSTESIFSKLP